VGVGDALAYALVTLLVLGMVAFTVLYRRLLSKAAEEYEKAGNTVRGLIATLKKRQDEQEQRAEQTSFDIEEAQAATDRAAIKLQELKKRISNLTRNTKANSTTNRNLTEEVKTVQREIQNILKTQDTLQRHITTLNKKIERTARHEKIETNLNAETEPLTNITETERQVLMMLVEEGPITSPKMEKKIRKTREHTARLMKKLWQDGYVERDTHRMPFTYHPTKELKKLLKKKTNNRKAY
jgi:predicted transcriptional regulator